MVNKKEKKEHCCCKNIAAGIFLTLITVALLFGLISAFMSLGQHNIEISLSQEVADEICTQLTGEDFALASDDYEESGYGKGGRLFCEVRETSSTGNIVVNR